MKVKRHLELIDILIISAIVMVAVIISTSINKSNNRKLVSGEDTIDMSNSKNTIVLNSDCNHNWKTLYELIDSPNDTITVACTKCGTIQVICLNREKIVINGIKTGTENIEN